MRLRTPAALILCAALAPLAHAQSLTTDTSSATYHTLVHLTASAAPAGTITFADNGNPITTLPVSPQGIAVLGIATLAPGTHTLSAGASTPVTVNITPIPTSAQLSADNSIFFQRSPIQLAFPGLPALATGSITWSDGATPLAITAIPLSPARPTYQAFGDSITAGYTLSDLSHAYPYLFAAANGFTSYLNYAQSGDTSCDVLPLHILPNNAGATQDVAPLYSLLIGTNDMDILGVPLGEPNFFACHQAALAWLAIPREYKVLPGDPGAAILTGPWALPPAQFDSTYGTLYNTGGSGAVTFTLTSNGGPLYLWYLMGDHLTGAFSLTLDGTPTGTTYTTSPATPIRSHNNPDSTGFALLRFPVAPGPHTLRVDIVSGTVGILGAATPPSPGAASVHPTVLAGADIPNQNAAQAYATPAMVAQFSADALADITLLQADGLDLRPVPTHAFLTTDPANFADFGHPNLLGHTLLAAAFQAVFAGSSNVPYQTRTPNIPRVVPNLNTLGLRTITATYAGDGFYAPATSSINAQVVPDSLSVTTLTSANTTFPAGKLVTASATVFPPNPGAVVTLMEGTQTLATAAIAYDTGTFAVSGLAPGTHILYASYAGDKTNAPSFSPPLTLQVLPASTTLTLTQPAAELAYAAPLTLTATLTPATATGNILLTDSYTPSGQTGAQIGPQTAQPLLQATLANGSAAFALPNLLPGTHILTAVYAGDTNDTAATSAPATTLIDIIPTATTLAASPAPYAQPSTFTATVSPAGATGNLSFTDSLSSTPIQATIQNGTATWTSSTLTPGTHTLSAAYAGDSTHAASTSPSLAVTIARDAASLTLAAPAAPLYAGRALTLTAALSPAAATGTILFSDPAAGVLGQATLTSGLATLTLPSLPAGSYNLTATYAGDANDLPATSSAVMLQVLSTSTVTSLTTPATSLYGSSVTLSASVTPAPTAGLLRFLENGNLLGTVALSNGTATLSTAALTPGTHTLTATFPGDSTHDPSTGTATLRVDAAPSTTTLTLAQSALLAGSPALVTIRVATSSTTIPTGTVVLRTGATSLATATLANGNAGAAYASISIPTATLGTYPITAFYSGDTTTTASDSSALALAYTVSPRIASGTLTLSAAQVPPQTPVTFTAAFTSPATSGPALVPTGSVTFFQGTTVLATVLLDATGQATYTPPPATLGTWAFSAAYAPTGVFSAAPVAPVTLTVTPPLALAFATSTLTMAPATSADAPLTLTTLSGFQGSVATQCTTPKAYLTCTVDLPTTLTGPATGKVHLAVARQTSALTLPGTGTALTCALLLPFCVRRSRRRILPTLLTLLCTAALATTLTGCAQGGTFSNVPSGTFLVQLTATAANTPTTATLTVNVQ